MIAAAGHRWVVLAAMLAACIVVSAVVPPTQAPDERSHLMRAYMVAHGQFVLDRGPEDARGGEVDSGLADFGAAWDSMRREPSVRASEKMVSAARAAEWTGESCFFEINKALATYPPVTYVPLAAGLGMGEWLGLSVWHSYVLARGMMIAAAIAVIGAAFAIVRPTPLVIASMVIPMSIFQLASPVIDGLCMALAALVASIFLRVVSDGERAPRWAVPVMAVAAAVVVTTRFYMLPLMGLVAIGFACTRRRGDLVCAALSALAVVGWVAYVVRTRPPRIGGQAAQLADTAAGTMLPIEKYIPALNAQWEKAVQTVGSSDWLWMQYQMYVGVLGSLDTPLASSAYPVIGVLLALAALASVRWSVIRTQRLAAITLCACGVVSAALVLVTLGVYFTQQNPTTPLRGVQGRYFLIPVMMIGYATATARGPVAESRARWWVGSAVSWVTIVVSMVYAVSALVDRYYGPNPV